MENVNKKILFLSLIMAIAFTAILYAVLKKGDHPSANLQVASVLVAAKDIPQGQKIKEDDVKEISALPTAIHPQALKQKSEIVGLYSKEKIFYGDQFVPGRAVKSFEESVGIRIPTGKRAVTINISEAAAVAFAPKAGDRVDVVASLEEGAKVIVQNVEFLYYGILSETAQKNAKEAAKTVTLLMTSQDAEKLALGEGAGQLKLLLRSQEDQNFVSTPGAKKTELLR